MHYINRCIVRAFSLSGASLATAASLLLTGCPTPYVPLPPTPRAPVILHDSLVCTVKRIQGDYLPAIRICWQIPVPTDSSPDAPMTPVGYTILRSKYSNGPYVERRRNVDPSIGIYIDDIDNSITSTVYYRIVGIDKYDRTGDTCAYDSIPLLEKAQLIFPPDTMHTRSVTWRVPPVFSSFFSWMELYDTTRQLYQEAIPSIEFYGNGNDMEIIHNMPASITLPTQGSSVWIAMYVWQRATKAWSVNLQKVYYDIP